MTQITTNHAASTYGIPVLLIDGVVCGPSEIAAEINAHDPTVEATWQEVQAAINRQWAEIQEGNPLMAGLVGAPTRVEILAHRAKAETR